jgi:hypothetical protein
LKGPELKCLNNKNYSKATAWSRPALHGESTGILAQRPIDQEMAVQNMKALCVEF